MSSLTRSETARWLRDHDNFLILTHRRPDGDTVGSAAVLWGSAFPGQKRPCAAEYGDHG